MNTVWVATGSDHDYDVGSNWVIGVFETLDGAKASCEEEYGSDGHWWADMGVWEREFAPRPGLWGGPIVVEIEEQEIRS